MLRIGLVINPYAGIGGSVGLKGSDGEQTRQQAFERGAEQRANSRSAEALAVLTDSAGGAQIRWLTAAATMGEDCLHSLGLQPEVVYRANGSQTEADDTQRTVQAMLDNGIDLLVFAGGDGTARDVYTVVGDRVPVVGIPAGVKIHSGVYAVSPRAAGQVIRRLVDGELTTLRLADVMDIDEDAFRQGQVRARRYGEMQVPGELEYMQAVKMGGRESDELVLADIAADVIESMDDTGLNDNALYIMGSGSTVEAIMDELGLDNTLLGVDAVVNQQLIGSDLTAAQLEGLAAQYTQVYLVVTVIGGQGHVFGRGNQQLSPALIRKVGRDNLIVVASKRKLQALNGRPLRVDTGDSALDSSLSGLIAVTTGYHDRTMVQIQSVD